MKAIIPAAGLGTRFLPWTKACPKELLPILDKPVIQWTIEELLKAQVRDIIIVISEGKEAIVKYFSPDKVLESCLQKQGKIDRLRPLNELIEKVNLNFVYQKGPYGNAAPILSAKNYIGKSEPFLVVWGDEFIFSRPPWLKQLTDCFEKQGESVLSAIKVEKELLASKGVAKVFSKIGDTYKIEKIVEKPAPGTEPSDICISGAYLLKADFWPYLTALKAGKDGEYWLVDAINSYAREKPVLAKLIKNAKFYDVGSKNKYYQAWRDLLPPHGL